MEGSVSKVDTRDGRELGRYRTGPDTLGSPSRTTVDLQGNCWVANRTTGSILKIGLYENGQYLDRNGNGRIDTSQDTNGDGDITGAEVLAWGQDECVLAEVIVIPGKEGTFVPDLSRRLCQQSLESRPAGSGSRFSRQRLDRHTRQHEVLLPRWFNSSDPANH